MAQPTNTFDSYDVNGIREDLSGIIYNVDPEDTPFYSQAKKTKAANTYSEWQTDALRASAANAHIEGDETTAEARTATTRLGNYTQIFKNAVTIPDTDDGLNKAGRGKEMGYQIMKVAKEQKLDIEKALLDNNARAAGNATTARELAGAETWLTTNTSAGSGGSDATGDGTDARTDGTQRALTQTLLDGVLQTRWENGGSGEASVYMGAAQMNVVLGFTGSNNQRATIDASKTQVVNVVDVYMTPWGTVKFIMSREIRARSVLVSQDNMWAIPVLRGTKQTPLAKTGDSEKRQVVTELTLACLNEKAHAGVFDLS